MTGKVARPSWPVLTAKLSPIRAAALAAALACGLVSAQPVGTGAAVKPGAAGDSASADAQVANSSLDTLLFYQVLIGELELNAGRAGNAFGVILDAARRNGDEALYQRAVEIALQARAGDQALEAARAWRNAKPGSVAPLRYQAQILLALNKPEEAIEPLAAWLAGVPLMEQPGLIAGLPRLLQGLADRQRALSIVEKLVLPYLDNPGARTASRVTLGRMHLAAGNLPQALGLARAAQTDDPVAPAPVLLALQMLPGTPAAETVVTDYLARADAEPAVRMAYVRQLTQSQRYADAGRQLDRLTSERPLIPEPWLMLGALRLELKQPREAETALLKYVELIAAATAAKASATPSATTSPALGGNPVSAAKPGSAAAGASKPEVKPELAAADGPASDDEDNESSTGPDGAGSNLTQAWLLLSQAAEQRGDVLAAEAWLAKVDSPQRALEVQSRRASLLARQGKIKEARALIQAVPERSGGDARAKLMAEAQMLRDVKRWNEAAEVLSAANQRFPDDVDLIYEQAMVEEKLDHLAEMERLLRRVIAIKPDHPHAHNALGYSLADRGLRLPEAHDLVARALELSPGDPFITDSLGWVEFRLGNRDEALRLLRQAYKARPDTEIAAHLGEVLWAAGQQAEARTVWQEARGRDAVNEVLRETLARLKVNL
jgi:tetratricopeptide (TPR) repeat protein